MKIQKVICGLIVLGAASIASAEIIQWKTEDGGNGHFYEAVLVPDGISWDDAESAAEVAGGYLATITSEEENVFVFNLIDKEAYWHQLLGSSNNHGPWIGGYQVPGSPEPAEGWVWVTGEPFGYTNWLPGEPTGTWGDKNENRLQFSSLTGTRGPTWNDIIDELPQEYAVYGYVIETIPEPATLLLFGLGSFALRRRRRA